MEREMKDRVLGVALVVVTLCWSGAASLATPQDYQFNVVSQPITAAHDAVIVVHVSPAPVHKLNITSQKLHMAMGSVDAPTKITPLPPDANGDFRFNADLTMHGEWTLDLVTAIAGESNPVEMTLKVQVVR
jgi:hypothetical protein